MDLLEAGACHLVGEDSQDVVVGEEPFSTSWPINEGAHRVFR